jgi:hypothetical protein
MTERSESKHAPSHQQTDTCQLNWLVNGALSVALVAAAAELAVAAAVVLRCDCTK